MECRHRGQFALKLTHGAALRLKVSPFCYKVVFVTGTLVSILTLGAGEQSTAESADLPPIPGIERGGLFNVIYGRVHCDITACIRILSLHTDRTVC